MVYNKLAYCICLAIFISISQPCYSKNDGVLLITFAGKLASKVPLRTRITIRRADYGLTSGRKVYMGLEYSQSPVVVPAVYFQNTMIEILFRSHLSNELLFVVSIDTRELPLGNRVSVDLGKPVLRLRQLAKPGDVILSAKVNDRTSYLKLPFRDANNRMVAGKPLEILLRDNTNAVLQRIQPEVSAGTSPQTRLYILGLVETPVGLSNSLNVSLKYDSGGLFNTPVETEEVLDSWEPKIEIQKGK